MDFDSIDEKLEQLSDAEVEELYVRISRDIDAGGEEMRKRMAAYFDEATARLISRSFGRTLDEIRGLPEVAA